MSTKLNASELAEQRYPDHLEPDAMIGVRPFQLTRLAFKCAVEEVAQPIADERDELREVVELFLKEYNDVEMYTPIAYFKVVHAAKAILAKYPKQ